QQAQQCPHCQGSLSDFSQDARYHADTAYVDIELLVRRELRIGDELQDAEGHAFTVADIFDQARMPTVNGQAVDVLVHPEATLVATLPQTASLRHFTLKRKRQSARQARLGRLHLRKATFQVE